VWVVHRGTRASSSPSVVIPERRHPRASSSPSFVIIDAGGASGRIASIRIEVLGTIGTVATRLSSTIAQSKIRLTAPSAPNAAPRSTSMTHRTPLLALILAALAVTAIVAAGGAGLESTAKIDARIDATIDDPSRIAIVWTSGDPDVAHRMTLMYAGAAHSRGWFDEVRLVVWGPSQRLVVADKDVRAAIERMIASGVIVEACLACADSYGIADDLRAIDGMTVKYMGEPLTRFIRSPEWSVITF